MGINNIPSFNYGSGIAYYMGRKLAKKLTKII